MKTVIDAFGMYAIEASLLGNLTNVFNPEVVINLDDVTITKIASESAESIVEREDLEEQLSTLEHSLKTIQRIEIRQVSGMLLPLVSNSTLSYYGGFGLTGRRQI